MKKTAAPLSSAKTSTSAICISIALAFITLFIFWRVAHCDFLNYDDDGYVTANSHVRQGLNIANVIWAFHTFETANWHPFTWLSLMLNAQLFGDNAAGFHLVNLFIHAANVVLLFFTLRQLTGAQWRSAFVAALFGWHPLHVESVAWISERKDVLSGLFFMLALLAYARFAYLSKINPPQSNSGATKKTKLFYALTLVAFICGLMSKPMLVTLPFVLLLLDFWPLQRISPSTIRRIVFEKTPFFILSAMSCVVTFAAQKQGKAVQTLAAFPINSRIENAAFSYWRYLAKTFWPANLAVPYPYSSHWPIIEISFAVLLIIGVSIASVFFLRKFPFFFTGWFWFMGMLIPVIGLVQVGQQSMADRYIYLPIIGIFIAVIWGTNEIIVRWKFLKSAAAVVAILILLALATQARRQISCWQNSETLFQHAIAVTKNNAEAYDHLGTYYLRTQNNVAAAADCFQKAVVFAPNRISGRINLGSIYLLQGKPDEAGQQFTEALRIDSVNADANCDLGFLLASRKQYDEAIAHYDKAIQTKPDFASAFHNRGLAFAAENNWTNAVRDYRAAIRFDPTHASTHTHLGIALLHESQTNEAAKEFNRALQLNPNDAEAAQQLQSLQK